MLNKVVVIVSAFRQLLCIGSKIIRLTSFSLNLLMEKVNIYIAIVIIG